MDVNSSEEAATPLQLDWVVIIAAAIGISISAFATLLHDPTTAQRPQNQHTELDANYHNLN